MGEAILKDVKPGAKPSAYEIAKAGGRNDGLYRRFKDSRMAEIEKSIRSYEKQISEHERKIQHPESSIGSGYSEAHRQNLINHYWPEEIAGFREKIDVMRGILAERVNV